MHTSKKPIPGARPAWPCWRWRPAGLAWTLWALVVLGLLAIGWLDQLLRQAGRADLAPLTAQTAAPMLAALTAATVGALLGSRRPRHPVGWLLLGFGLSLTAIGIFMGYANYGLLAGSDALPAARAAVRYYPTAIDAVSGAVGSFVLLLTPTGALPSPRWRWWAGVTAAVLVVLLLVVTLAPEPLIGRYQAGDTPLRPHAFGGALLVANQVAFAVTLVAVVGAAASLVGRFRRARGVERQQLRWVAWAAATAAPTAVVVLAALALGSPAVFWASAYWLPMVPLAIGAAILRYRLYDLDRIISRTLAYGLLTVLLGGGYAGVVLGLGQLLGQNRSLTVAAATLAVAAAFQPTRRRIQAAVDPRFNRRRYDATQTVAAFSARLRDQVDLGTLTPELLGVVEQTMQPTQVSLWLRPVPRSEASTTGAAVQHRTCGTKH